MPQSSEYLQDKWGGFYHPVGEEKAMTYLQDKGYILTSGWCWANPLGLEPDDEDLEAMQFLIEEWDFGGLEEDENDSGKRSSD